MSCPMIVEVLEVVSVNDYTKKPDAHGVIETVRYVSLKCDGFMLNVRAPLNMEIPVGYSAKCLIECLPYTGVSRDRARVSFTPHEIVKFKVGEKVVKRNLLDEYLSPSPAPTPSGVGASSSLKK